MDYADYSCPTTDVIDTLFCTPSINNIILTAKYKFLKIIGETTTIPKSDKNITDD